MSESARISVTLPREVVDQIKQLAQTNNTTLATAITESVQINDRITRAEKQRAKIIVRDPDGSMMEIVRRRG